VKRIERILKIKQGDKAGSFRLKTVT